MKISEQERRDWLGKLRVNDIIYYEHPAKFSNDTIKTVSKVKTIVHNFPVLLILDNDITVDYDGNALERGCFGFLKAPIYPYNEVKS